MGKFGGKSEVFSLVGNILLCTKTQNKPMEIHKHISFWKLPFYFSRAALFSRKKTFQSLLVNSPIKCSTIFLLVDWWQDEPTRFKGQLRPVWILYFYYQLLSFQLHVRLTQDLFFHNQTLKVLLWWVPLVLLGASNGTLPISGALNLIVTFDYEVATFRNIHIKPTRT